MPTLHSHERSSFSFVRLKGAGSIGHRSVMRALSLLRVLFGLVLVCGARPSVANAQPPAPQRLALEVDPAIADAEELARALEQDLGVAVDVGAADGASTVLRIALSESGALRLELTRDGSDPLRREIEPPEHGERIVTLALIAANLVRDQLTEILALLYVERAPSAALDPPVAIEEPPVEDDALRLDDVPVAIDFAPAVGFSSGFFGRDRRNVSLGALGALMGELFGLSISGVVDLVLGDASGAQIAGLFALAHGLRGVQIAGGLALTLRDVEGLQIAPASLAGGSVHGAQLGAVHIVGGRLHGLQIGAVDLVHEETNGVQIGALALSGGYVEGAQIAAVNVAGEWMSGVQIGAVNVSGQRASGVQIGAVNVSGEGMNGLQLGAANIAGGDVEGAQIGAVNVSAGRVRGVQIGVVNIAEDADASIGLVSIHARGRTQIRVGADSGGLLSTNVVHGLRLTHSILSVSTQPFQARPAVLLGLGFGMRATFEESMHFDVDVLSHIVMDERVSNAGPSSMFELRAVFGVQLFDIVGIYAGLGYQLHVERQDEPGGLGGPIGLHAFSDSVRGWPVLLGGIELF